MDCIDIRITRVVEPITASATLVDDAMAVGVTILDCIDAVVQLVESPRIYATCSVLDVKINVNCGIVCGIADTSYLLVTPKEIQWIDENTDAVYQIVSNVEWEIN